MNINAMLQTLPLMLRGMLGIFAVTAVIILAMYLLNYIGNKKERYRISLKSTSLLTLSTFCGISLRFLYRQVLLDESRVRTL